MLVAMSITSAMVIEFLWLKLKRKSEESNHTTKMKSS